MSSSSIGSVYASSLALLTDLYELTMAYGYWKHGRQDYDAVFHLTFRKTPFGGGYAVAAGLGPAVELLDRFGFDSSDLDYLAGLRGNDERPLFEDAFLEDLATLRFGCDVDAMPEGTVVFAHEPLLRVRGPLWQAQLCETSLLNAINFPTLVATQAARICQAARGDPVLELGLRRAQGIDGSLSASRAAYIGGVAATSNVLAGKLFGIPVKGTHAHSWVMAYPTEHEAFAAYAQAMPNNCLFLVDTFDTVQGVRNAIEVGMSLRAAGHEMLGIRLDSGDLAWLSIEARKALDAAGFPDAVIVGSNDLDERLIESLKSQGARIDIWGVGTKLVTAYGQPALGGVYKLSAIRAPGGRWVPKIKLSEQAIKISNPGTLQVRRYIRGGELRGDLIYDEHLGIRPPPAMIDPMDPTRSRRFDDADRYDDLLVPVFRAGERVYQPPALSESRALVQRELGRLHDGVKRFDFPHQYPVGLEAQLHALKTRLILEARSGDRS